MGQSERREAAPRGAEVQPRKSSSGLTRFEDFWISRFGPSLGGILAGATICVVVLGGVLLGTVVFR